MKKVVMVVLALAMFTTVSFGCRASADVDPHDSASVTAPR